MHIPDGYLSPGTCAVLYVAMTPVWIYASKKAETGLKLKQLPLLSLGAAFSFIIMMFNVPVPGGSSGHMVGAVIAAIILGPWAAVIALSLALTLQAFFFGDGGLTTLGANCFNMAFLMSFSGYWTYTAIAGEKPGALKRIAASAAGGYAAINVAALGAAIELGLQPLIAHDGAGRPLYAPYPLAVTMPALMISHLVIFGPIEALGTALTVSYLSKTGEEGLIYNPAPSKRKTVWVILALMIILTPLGLIASGTPWGEWSKDEVKNLVGFIPAGMDSLSGLWRGVMPGYDSAHLRALFGEGGGRIAAYVISAAIGSAAVVGLIFIWGKLWRRRR